MRTDRPVAVPLLAQLSVRIPSEKPQDREKPPQRETRYTLVAHETTDEN